MRRSVAWLCFLVVAAASLCTIVEHDTPWYLASGELILRTRSLPAHDPFSFTSTIPWLNHEWLAEVLLALVYRAGGWTALAVLSAVGVAAPIFILAGAEARRRLAGAAPLVWVLAAFVLRETTSPRATLFSNLLFAATLALVLADEDRHPRRLFWCLPIQLLWTQVHGGNPLGVAVLGLRFLTGPTRTRLVVLVACALLTMAGPYGWRVHAHFLSAHAALPMIREWYPLWPSLAQGLVAPWVFVVLALAAALASIVQLRRGDRQARLELALVLVFTIAGLRAARFATEGSLVAAAVLARHLARSSIGSGLLVPSAIAAALLLSQGSARRLGTGLDPDRFPEHAVAWLRTNDPPGPMFNSYNYGGYLLWARPEEKVFIDGRAFTVYAPELLEELPALYAAPERFEALTRRYGLRLAVLQRSGRGAALNAWLAANPSWRLLYEDPQAQIFGRF